MHLLRHTLGASGGCYLDTRVQMRGSFRACKERRNLTTYRRSFNLGVQKMGIWKAWCRSPLKWCLMRLPAILTLQMVKALEVTASRPLFTKLLLGHSVSPLASHPPCNTSLASICPETVRLNCYSYSLPRELPAYLTFFGLGSELKCASEMSHVTSLELATCSAAWSWHVVLARAAATVPLLHSRARSAPKRADSSTSRCQT